MKPVELTLRSVILATFLTLLLAVSNAYLALKLGILASASIPAAILSMGILRFFKNSTILENNITQTAASAGQAVAGGIVYTIPALVILQYWTHFDYFTNFFIALTGGILGVLFSIPLRRILVNETGLKFPEGRAIAEVLKSSTEKTNFKAIFWGGFVGGILELFQTGFKLIANSWSYWFKANGSLFGFGVGFSPAMIGAGYLIGYEMGLSIFLGAIFSWGLALPVISQFYPEIVSNYLPSQGASLIWEKALRSLGIGAMLFSGAWAFIKLVKPLGKSLSSSLNSFSVKHKKLKKELEKLNPADQDIPGAYLVMGILTIAAILFLLFQVIFPVEIVGLSVQFAPTLIFGLVLYVLLIGFLFSVITGYFSAMVGVSASPGSSIVIGGLLITAWILWMVINYLLPVSLNENVIKGAEAMAIIIASVITGIAAIANDNIQDLKVGQLVGATPWKQQLMLLWGVLISALIIPLVMQLLFEVHGIAGVMPHEGMDVTQSLPAPPAALLAAMTEAVFHQSMPWTLLMLGAGVIVSILLLSNLARFSTKKEFQFKISIMGFAIGMYLPLSTSFPLLIGSLIAKSLESDRTSLKKQNQSRVEEDQKHHIAQQKRGILIACGLISGAAVVDVLLAVPFSILRSSDALSLVKMSWHPYSVCFGFLAILGLSYWMRAERFLNKKGD